MGSFDPVFAYVGPETLVPLTSVVAGAVGAIMIFGRGSWRFAAKVLRRLTSKP